MNCYTNTYLLYCVFAICLFVFCLSLLWHYFVWYLALLFVELGSAEGECEGVQAYHSAQCRMVIIVLITQIMSTE